MTPTLRLTTALRSLADALEGNGRHPLPCSDPEMPARRLMDIIAGGSESDGDNYDITEDDAGLLTFVGVLSEVIEGKDPIDVLCNFGLCDE